MVGLLELGPAVVYQRPIVPVRRGRAVGTAPPPEHPVGPGGHPRLLARVEVVGEQVVSDGWGSVIVLIKIVLLVCRCEVEGSLTEPLEDVSRRPLYGELVAGPQLGQVPARHQGHRLLPLQVHPEESGVPWDIQNDTT